MRAPTSLFSPSPSPSPKTRRSSGRGAARLGGTATAVLGGAGVAGLVIACLVLFAATRAAPASHAVSHATPSPVVATPASTPDARSLLASQMDNGVTEVTAFQDKGYSITATITVKDGVWGEWEVKQDILVAMRTLYTSTADPSSVTLTYVTLMGDQYGNNVLGTVAVVTLTEETASHFDWWHITSDQAWSDYDQVNALPDF